jgi:hypothetical protein
LVELLKENISGVFDPYPQKPHLLPNVFRVTEEDKRLPYVSVKNALVGLEEPENSDDLAQKVILKLNLWESSVKVKLKLILKGLLQPYAKRSKITDFNKIKNLAD